MCKAVKISVVGRVQGVGFRPFLYQVAKDLALKGTVQNNMDGVEVILEGMQEQIDDFLYKLSHHAPRLSRVDEIAVREHSFVGYEDFTIIPSKRVGASQLVIPVDASVCEDCTAEMNDPTNFRYQYPFITCTQCGPRYTIIDELPYDRPFTSMASFDLCPSCLEEYNDPFNRRHHAQPIACPNCGPQLSLMINDGTIVAERSEALKQAGDLIRSGQIIAIKGIGGFHLCCDATNEKAVHRLRERKNRPKRPLAVMSDSIEAVKKYAMVSADEEKMLLSPEAPIVVLAKNEEKQLAESVAPNMTTIGVMLPYSPLHQLLLNEVDKRTLVMTSANVSGLPIAYQNEECLKGIGTIADFYLMHNRDILHPVDDSVVQVINGQPDFFRKSRGYVPDPIHSSANVNGIIAFGGQQKTTFTIGRNAQVFMGPHIGDLQNLNTINHYKNELKHLIKWIQPQLQIGVVDYHPLYESRRIAAEYEFKEVMEVQHHHAHMAACIADNEIDEEVFGIILDGTGYGLDGNIWGFEIFYGDCKDFQRLAYLQYSALPGGEACIREPWRNAVGMLVSLLGEEGFKISHRLFPSYKHLIPVLRSMVEKNMNTVYAGTCGRLFDAVSSMIGLCNQSTYDGEAAITLSELAQLDTIVEPYRYEIQNEDSTLMFNFSQMLVEIYNDILQQRDIKEISTAFHETIVQSIVEAMKQLRNNAPNCNRKVVLSGGSLHNRYLKVRLTECLREEGFEVFTHRRIPCNDGGLSYGQLMVAAAKRRK